MELGLEDQRARTIYMKFSRKASFSFAQKFLRRSNKAFGGLLCVFHDLVMSVCCSFMVELKFLKNFEQACDCFNNGSFTVKNT